MSKGHEGQSCTDAIQEFVISSDRAVTYTEILLGIQSKGDWKVITIWRILISNIVNLVPARYEWPHSHPSLLLRPDGKYELYDRNKHPEIGE